MRKIGRYDFSDLLLVTAWATAAATDNTNNDNDMLQKQVASQLSRPLSAETGKDSAAANRSRSASTTSGLQPIAAHLHACIAAKNSELLPLRSRPEHGWHHGVNNNSMDGTDPSLRDFFPNGDFPVVGLGVTAMYGLNVGLKEPNFPTCSSVITAWS